MQINLSPRVSAPCTTKTAPVSYWISLALQQPRLNINIIIIVLMDAVSGTEVRYNVSSTVRVHVTESVSNHEVYWPVLLRAGS